MGLRSTRHQPVKPRTPPSPAARARLRRADHRSQGRGRTELATAADLYTRGLSAGLSTRGRPYAASTVRTYREEVAAFVAWCGDLPLTAIDADLVVRHLAELRAAGRADSYVQTRDKVLRLFLGWCVEQRFLAGNPLARVRRTRAADPPVTALTDLEVQRLLAACPGDRWDGVRNAAILHVLWRCGLRASEACRLDLADYDAGRAALVVRGTKSDAARRIVGVPDDCALALDDWLVRARGTEAGVLFPSERGVPLLRTSFSRLVRLVGERAGVDDLHPHRLRHTFAVNFLRAGGDIFILSRLLGHSTVQMSARYLRGLQAEAAAETHVRLMRRGR